MTYRLHLYSLPVSKIVKVRMDETDYFLNLFLGYKNKYKTISQESKCRFDKIYTNKEIFIDSLYYFNLVCKTIKNNSESKQDNINTKLVNKDDSDFTSNHYYAMLEIAERFDVKKIPIEWNGMKLIVDEDPDYSFFFIDIAQIKDLDLEKFKQELFLFIRSTPDRATIPYSYGEISDIVDFFKKAKQRGEDIFYFTI